MSVEALQAIFGFTSFRPGQAEAVDAGVAGRDALVVMPTGAGKSLCYQLPALMRDDLTIVVSPLVSLMQDQVAALEAVAPGRVEVVNASRSGSANASSVQRAVGAEVRLLYVAPERFGSARFVEAIRAARVGLFVVDEAHCVSQWGHDFRPDYFRLADAARFLRAGSTMALTATATPYVARDIARRLALRDPVTVTTGFDRPGLTFSVVPCGSGYDKRRRLVAALSAADALPAIVYAGTRAAVEELTAFLNAELGVPVVGYHAGLPRDARASIQEQFMAGAAPVIVATNAFGMGIDKADVRTVAHATVPASLEAYYQEAGRAGRDSLPARCVLFAEQRDKGLHVFFIERSRVDDDAFVRVSERLRWAGADGLYDVRLAELAAVAGPRADEDTARSVVGHLARAGLVEPAPSVRDRAAGRITGDWDSGALVRCRTSAREAEQARWRQYRAIWEYVDRSGCRRDALLRHFGDRSGGAPHVACCDVCAPESVAFLAPAAMSPAAVAPGARAPVAGSELDQAIVEVVVAARPAVGRTRAVEILRGGRSKVIADHSYDRLPGYGTFSHLRTADVLGRVDELLAAGRLRSSGGRFPKLRVVPAPRPQGA